MYTCRRVFQAAQKFCESYEGRLDEHTARKVDDYFRYISSGVDNALENQDFALLSPSLRAQFVQSRCSDTLRQMRLINHISSDQVFLRIDFDLISLCSLICAHKCGVIHQDLLNGFVYSLCEEMELYLAIPGENFDCQQQECGNVERWRDGDILILRRGMVVAQCGRKKSYFQPGQRIDLQQAMQLLNGGEKEKNEEDEPDIRSPRIRPRKYGQSRSVGCIPEEENYHFPLTESPVEHKANDNDIADDINEKLLSPTVSGMLYLTTADFFHVHSSFVDCISSAILRLETADMKVVQKIFFKPHFLIMTGDIYLIGKTGSIHLVPNWFG